MAAFGLVVAGTAAFALLRDDPGSEVRRSGDTGSQAPVTAGSVPIQIPVGGAVRLVGVLDLPQPGPGPAPGVVIVPGFGPTNRDGVAPSGVAVDPLYRDVGQTLVSSGLATFRYDKRGRGETLLPPEQPLRLEDLVDDARAALSFLADRRGVDAQRLALVGHDEGGLIALRIAATDPRVKAVVLLSTPGRPLVEVLADDVLHGAADAATGQAQADSLRRLVAGLLTTGSLPGPEAIPRALQPVFPAGQERYLQAIFALDPPAEAARGQAPVLVVRGGADTGVSAADAARLAGALGARAEVIVSEGTGHTLTATRSGSGAGSSPTTSGPAGGTAAADDHDAAFHQGVASPGRDMAVLARIAAWLTSRLQGAG